MQNRVVRGDGPTAVQSKLGYLLSGPLPSSNNESISITPEVEETSGANEMKRYMDTCVSYKNNQYSVKLSWKEDHPPLPTNSDVSARRTQNMVKRLRRDLFLFRKYDDIINEQFERGFLEAVDEDSQPSHHVHYITHHGIRKYSMTTPIRIVYDCSCRRSPSEPSLNDCLQSTPPELNDQAGILMRFRLNRYAVTTDIEKAF